MKKLGPALKIFFKHSVPYAWAAYRRELRENTLKESVSLFAALSPTLVAVFAIGFLNALWPLAATSFLVAIGVWRGVPIPGRTTKSTVRKRFVSDLVEIVDGIAALEAIERETIYEVGKNGDTDVEMRFNFKCVDDTHPIHFVIINSGGEIVLSRRQEQSVAFRAWEDKTDHHGSLETFPVWSRGFYEEEEYTKVSTTPVFHEPITTAHGRCSLKMTIKRWPGKNRPLWDGEGCSWSWTPLVDIPSWSFVIKFSKDYDITEEPGTLLTDGARHDAITQEPLGGGAWQLSGTLRDLKSG